MEHVHRADEDHALLVNIADHSHSLTHGCKYHTQVTLIAKSISLKYGCKSRAQVTLITISLTHEGKSHTQFTLIARQ